MQIRIAGVVQDSIVDGPGNRFTLFTQGCPHHCPGCHNPDSHAFDGGRLTDTDTLIADMRRNPLLDGLTLSGGEPFCQAEACLLMANAAHQAGLNVWAYTGYTFEQLLEEADPARMALLSAIDVLVDGPFLLAQKSLAIQWRGSGNQRLLDMSASLAAKKSCAWHSPAPSWDDL